MSQTTESEGEETYDAFDQFVNGDPYKLFDWIADGHVDKDACDDDHGESLLIWAARHRIYELVKFLVKKGCDINHIAHSDGQTALDICKNNTQLCAFLRENGAKTEKELADVKDYAWNPE